MRYLYYSQLIKIGDKKNRLKVQYPFTYIKKYKDAILYRVRCRKDHYLLIFILKLKYCKHMWRKNKAKKKES